MVNQAPVTARSTTINAAIAAEMSKPAPHRCRRTIAKLREVYFQQATREVQGRG